jgi:class 3 adenylate cyclase/tetratricopeptide (TPR) repeat protein
MFCDLVGSTELGQRLDPEELRDVVATYQDACSAAVKRFEGHVAQYLGDGVLVYFGFPLAHEDDAERAVRTALAIQSSLTELNRERSSLGEIAARIGIHTGLVVMSEMGDDARQPLALGDTINVASRLEGVAEPGGIVISQTTLELVPGLFVTRELGTPNLKGISDPIYVYSVDGAAGVGGHHHVPKKFTPLSGRELELGQFQDRWEEVQEGRGQVVAITGEAGIGKSRLIVALREALGSSPHTWLEIRCSPYISGSAFQPVIELYQRGFGFADSDPPEVRLEKMETGLAGVTGLALEEVAPYLGALLELPASERFPLPQMGSELRREKTLQALLAPFLAVESLQPVLLACEDLHWCDPSTLELLGRMIEQVPTLRALLVLSYRPNFEPPWSLAHSYVSPITLSRLSRRHTKEIIGAASGGRLPERVLDEIVARADGVPLFAEELTRSVVDSGLIVENAGRFEFRGRLSDLAIPSTLQGSLMARLDRLSAAKQVAQLAATLGREFPYELIEATSELDVPTLRSGLAQLVEAEVLYQRGAPPDSSYTFKHALLQDTAYESQLKSRRRELHARVVGIIEERFPQQIAAEPERIARHCAEGRLVPKAIAYYQQAGGQALSRLANAEAVEYFGRALDELGTLPANDERHQQEIGLRLALLGPLTTLRGYEHADVLACFARAEELCEALGSGPQQLAGLVGLAVYQTQRGDLPKAARYAEALLQIADPLGIAPLQVAGHMIVGSAAITAAPIPLACEHLAKGIEIARATELPPPSAAYDLDVLCVAHSSQAIALILNAQPERGLESMETGLQRATRLGHVYTTGSAQLNSAIGCYFIDDAERTKRYADACLETIGGLDFHTPEATAQVFRGWARSVLGDVEAGVAETEDGLARTEASGAMGGLVQLYFTGTDTMLNAGRLERASVLLERAAASIERTQERAAFEPQIPMFRAALLMESGQGSDDEIEALLLDSIERWRAFESTWMELRSALLIGRHALRTGRKEPARKRLADLYSGFSEGFGVQRLLDAKALLEQLT